MTVVVVTVVVIVLCKGSPAAPIALPEEGRAGEEVVLVVADVPTMGEPTTGESEPLDSSFFLSSLLPISLLECPVRARQDRRGREKEAYSFASRPRIQASDAHAPVAQQHLTSSATCPPQ